MMKAASMLQEMDKKPKDMVDQMADSLEEEFVWGFDPVVDEEVAMPMAAVPLAGLPYVEDFFHDSAAVVNQWNPDFFGRNTD